MKKYLVVLVGKQQSVICDGIKFTQKRASAIVNQDRLGNFSSEYFVINEIEEEKLLSKFGTPKKEESETEKVKPKKGK